MPRTCTVCTHEQRLRIDEALLAGRSFRDISGQYGIGTSSLHRHRHDHIPTALAKAQEVQEIGDADALLGQVQALGRKAIALLDKAEADGDTRGAIVALKEVRGCIELQGKVTGELAKAQRETPAKGVSLLDAIRAADAMEDATPKPRVIEGNAAPEIGEDTKETGDYQGGDTPHMD